ncbi:MAG: putative zinc-binding protein [Methanospirillum sp.]|uniref:putative zinc-binding protein n=1 Tax=Methanospirillum sp. TaxID=45200 RepID=UPI00236C9C6F|nr:putative zinc-binding protein [Methanospirillum sp.]MDD1728277.1 putative zinc-binding protein [Methanospirillum sp.]
MAEQGPCSCGGGDKSRIIFPCCGQANTGQISNAAAIQLDEETYGGYACTALLASSEALAKRANEVDEVVAIDGCGMHCAKKIAENAGVPVHQHLVITDLGIEKKSGDRSFTPDQVEAIASAAWKGEGELQESGKGKKPSDGSGGCGCSGKCC